MIMYIKKEKLIKIKNFHKIETLESLLRKKLFIFKKFHAFIKKICLFISESCINHCIINT